MEIHSFSYDRRKQKKDSQEEEDNTLYDTETPPTLHSQEDEEEEETTVYTTTTESFNTPQTQTSASESTEEQKAEEAVFKRRRCTDPGVRYWRLFFLPNTRGNKPLICSFGLWMFIIQLAFTLIGLLLATLAFILGSEETQHSALAYGFAILFVWFPTPNIAPLHKTKYKKRKKRKKAKPIKDE